MSEATRTISPAATAPVQTEVDRSLRHNYWVTVIEGGSFMAGTAFLNANTVLPDVIRQLGGSPLLISLAPSMMMLGFLLPPVLTAHWIDSMHRFKPIVSLMGIFQRLPYLAAAIALFLAAEGSSGLALAAVALAPLISGIMGGISATAWQQLVARCVPGHWRASLFAHRYIIGCTAGVVAGWVIAYVLREYSLLRAYAILHLIAFVFLTISMIVFLMTREPQAPAPARQSLTLLENLRLMPRLVAAQKWFKRYLLSRMLRNGVAIIAPFLAIYARQKLGLPGSFLGTLVIAQSVGAILGSLGAAWLGDRAGGKIVNQIGTGMFVAIAGWAILADSAWQFIAISFLYGTAQFTSEIGAMTLMLDIVPHEKRSTYLALISLVNIPGMLLASLISSTIWRHTNSITWIAVATIITLGSSMLLLQPLREPRHTALKPAQPPTEPPADAA